MSGKRVLGFLSFCCLLWMVACGGTGATSETQVVELAKATKVTVYSSAEATVTESAPAETTVPPMPQPTAARSPTAAAAPTEAYDPAAGVAHMAQPPPGLLLALGAKSQGWRLAMVKADGQLQTLVEQIAPQRYLPDFDVSPDGSQLLFAYADDIWRLELASAVIENVTNTPERKEQSPRWWLSAERTADFICGSRPVEAGEGPAHGYLTLVGFDGRYEVLVKGGELVAPPAPGPDGQTIAYSRLHERESVPFFYRPDSGEATLNLTTYGLDWVRRSWEASWSPDGRYLAWGVAGSPDENDYAAKVVLDLSQRTHLVLHRFRPAPTNIIPAPRWSPDSRWLTFTVLDQDPGASGLWWFELEGGVVEQLAPTFMRQSAVRLPATSPTGDWIAAPLIDGSGVGLVKTDSLEAAVWTAPDGVAAVSWANPQVDSQPEAARPTAIVDSVAAPAPTAVAERVPQIASFTAETVADGVRLSWETVGGYASICPLVGDQPLSCHCLFDLPPTGTAHVAAAEAIGRYSGFELTAVADGAAARAAVSAGLPCPDYDLWFMDNPPAMCPVDGPMSSTAAAQPFERGQMIWLEATDTYYILYNQDLHLAAGGSGTSALKSLRILQGPLQFQPGASADNRVAETPPSGLFEPVSGFGLLWRGEVVGSDGLRAQLGWATASEYGFSTSYQCAHHCGSSWNCYLHGPEGQVLHFYFLLHFGHYWEVGTGR